MIGRTIAQYEILERIGEGGAGVLYKARDTRLGRVVTLKFMQDRTPRDPECDRLMREARAVAKLNHPNICTIHEVGEANDQAFIAMEYIEGRDLQSVIRERAMSPREVADIGLQVARGLEAAHQHGIVHHDVKCGNIMLTDDGRAVLTDFGLATMDETPLATGSDTVVGSLAYMSPEQLRGDAVDERTDVWSLGVCLYTMLAGRLPFSAPYEAALGYAILNEDIPPLSELRPGLPFTLGLVVETAMRRRIDARYRKMKDMRVDLEAALSEITGDAAVPVSRSQAPASVAVLPFTDLSETHDQEYFCDGMTEEIINDLAQLDMLRVVSRTSSFAFKGKPDDVRAIGRKLGAGYVLEGSVRRSGESVRVTAQLINVADGLHMWSKQYNRKMTEVFAIQEEIACSIAEALEISLGENDTEAMHKGSTSNVDAYERYLRGRQLFYQTKRSNIDRARDLFAQAIENDPRFARAYAGMADCYSYLYWYFDRNPDNLESAITASETALRLEPELAEAHAAHGLALTLSERYEEAEAEYVEAARLNPMLFEAYYFHARTRFVQGDLEGAARLFEQACAVEPEGYQAPMMLGFVLNGLKKEDRARAVYQRGLENVEKHLEANPEDSRAFYLASSALIGTGQVEKALRYSMRAVAVDPSDSYILYGVACNYARLGEVEESVYYFERAVRCGFAHKQWIENDSDLDPIRNHPRFQALVASLEA